jgi:hypothetical protein
MADEPKEYPRKSAAAKKRVAREQPTPRQSRFAKALMKSKNLAQAAIAAGNSSKNASQSEHQAICFRHRPRTDPAESETRRND